MNKKQTQTISFKKRKIELVKFQDKINGYCNHMLDIYDMPNSRYMRRFKERELRRSKK